MTGHASFNHASRRGNRKCSTDQPKNAPTKAHHTRKTSSGRQGSGSCVPLKNYLRKNADEHAPRGDSLALVTRMFRHLLILQRALRDVHVHTYAYSSK
jgi:hypothetical protein